MFGDGCSVQPWFPIQQAFTGCLPLIPDICAFATPRPMVASYFTKVKVNGVCSEASALKAIRKPWQ